MANMNLPFGAPSSSLQQSGAAKDRKMATAESLVLDLSNPHLRENALLELSKVQIPFEFDFWRFSNFFISIFCADAADNIDLIDRLGFVICVFISRNCIMKV